jgi:hypothetical protein
MGAIEEAKRQNLIAGLRPHVAQLIGLHTTSSHPFSPSAKVGPVATEIQRLYDWLLGGSDEEWTPRTAVGRLRHLYRQKSQKPYFSQSLIAALGEIVTAFPFLADAPEMVSPSEGSYHRVGGQDKRAAIGYDPQHRSRLLARFYWRG